MPAGHPEQTASPPPRLVLASASPRRKELLEGVGVAVEVRPAAVDETPWPGEPPTEHVLRLAREKARAVARPGEIALGADTVVLLDGAILGKPGGAAEARGMLRRLAGRTHEVLTGVAVCAGGGGATHAGVERSRVRFGTMSEREIDWYVGSGEPFDKAGGYAVQGLGALFVESVAGNYSNVVGLPLPLARRLLREAGVDLLTPRI
jgi:septum formation protein